MSNYTAAQNALDQSYNHNEPEAQGAEALRALGFAVLAAVDALTTLYEAHTQEES